MTLQFEFVATHSAENHPLASQRQINVRLDDEDFEEFWTAAFIEGRSLPEELRAAVRAHLNTFKGNSYFEEALSGRLGQKKEQEPDKPNVSSLDDKRKRTRRGSDA